MDAGFIFWRHLGKSVDLRGFKFALSLGALLPLVARSARSAKAARLPATFLLVCPSISNINISCVAFAQKKGGTMKRCLGPLFLRV